MTQIEKRILISMRIGEIDPACTVPASQMRHCERCHASVCLSPSAFDFSREATIVCRYCVRDDELSAMQAEGIKLLPRQRQEIVEWVIGRN